MSVEACPIAGVTSLATVQPQPVWPHEELHACDASEWLRRPLSWLGLRRASAGAGMQIRPQMVRYTPPYDDAGPRRPDGFACRSRPPVRHAAGSSRTASFESSHSSTRTAHAAAAVVFCERSCSVSAWIGFRPLELASLLKGSRPAAPDIRTGSSLQPNNIARPAIILSCFRAVDLAGGLFLNIGVVSH